LRLLKSPLNYSTYTLVSLPWLSCFVTAVGKDCLAGNPPSIGREEFHDGHNVLDLGQLAIHRLQLVVGHAIRRFLAIEEGRVHRPGANGVNRDTASSKLLGGGSGKILYRRLAARVGRISIREGGQ